MQPFAQHHPGVLIEEKSFGVALHYPLAPEAGTAARSPAGQLGTVLDLQVQPCKMVFELRPQGADKGAVVLSLMRRPSMAGTRLLFLGDDMTDEAGFAVVRELGGAGILVGTIVRPWQAIVCATRPRREPG